VVARLGNSLFVARDAIPWTPTPTPAPPLGATVGPFELRAVRESKMLIEIAHEEPTALGRMRHDLSPEVIAVVEKSLHKNIDRRYADAGELLADLSAIRAQWGELGDD
jgi:hypothetical protein